MLKRLALLAVGLSWLAYGQQVLSTFTLINADNATAVAGFDPLVQGATIDLALTPTRNLNIRANTTPTTVGSVVFDLDGTVGFRTETTAPYALHGDISGVYNPWTPSVGAHTVTGTPWTGGGGSGTAGTPLTVGFSVIDSGAGAAGVTGELKLWHKITVTFVCLSTTETTTPNPFRDYRLNVTFTHPGSGQTRTVAGYYSADGNAGVTGATSGDKWKAHFTPDLVGVWNYVASFRTGTDVAMNASPTAGTATSCDGSSGSLGTIAATDKSSPDFRAKGLLRYVGQRYLQFAGTGGYFIQGGTGGPENFLGYADFDQTSDTNGSFLHTYSFHVADWVTGDPTWGGGLKGKGIIGALNYLSSKGMNSFYFLTYNLDGGDGGDVWPWTGSAVRDRYDVSKLDQWEIVFEHMDKKGIQLDMFTQEIENNSALDGGTLGSIRTLYYRELIARFGHHLGVVWNIGEENSNSDANRKLFMQYFRTNDPYAHPTAIHNQVFAEDALFNPLLGFAQFENSSLQESNPATSHAETIQWVDSSLAAGRPWLVTLDEIGSADIGVLPDANDPNHDSVRQQVLWGNLMAGGAGVQWYYGYANAHTDLNLEDFRSRDLMFSQTKNALDFFQTHLTFTAMNHADALTSSSTDYVLAQPGTAYAVYLPTGGTTNLDLASSTATFNVQWFNPKTNAALQNGTVLTITGPGLKSIGTAPFGGDAVARVSVQAAVGGGGSRSAGRRRNGGRTRTQ